MKTSVRRWSVLLSIAVLSAGLAGYAAAQAKRATGPAPRQGTPALSPHRGQIDMYLAEGVFLDNDNEIALAKIAQTRAESKDVVKFAETMVEDHEQFAKELEKYSAPKANKQGANQPAASPQTRGAAGESDGTADRSGAAAANNAPRAKTGGAQPVQVQAGGVQVQVSPQYDRLAEAFVEIHQEIAKECRENAQHELESKKGAEFDKCYMGMQLAAHMKMIDVLTVFERHASPELARVFKNGRATSQKHFDRAKETMKELDKGSARETTSE